MELYLEIESMGGQVQVHDGDGGGGGGGGGDGDGDILNWSVILWEGWRFGIFFEIGAEASNMNYGRGSNRRLKKKIISSPTTFQT